MQSNTRHNGLSPVIGGFVPLHTVQRFIVEPRNGGLFVGHVPVHFGHRERLSHDTVQALGLNTDERAQRSGKYYRLSTCLNCSQQFIAHFRVHTCSLTCADVITQSLLARRNRPTQQGLCRLNTVAADGDPRAADMLRRVLDPNDSMTVYDACVALGWWTSPRARRR